MRHWEKNIDQVTKKLLQLATVKTPSKEFTPRLMKMMAQEKRVEQSTLAELLRKEEKPWAVYTITGICLAIFAGFSFLLLKDVSFGITSGPDTMQMLSTPLADYARILCLSLQQYYLIPIVINATCLLILLDRFFRRKILLRI